MYRLLSVVFIMLLLSVPVFAQEHDAALERLNRRAAVTVLPNEKDVLQISDPLSGHVSYISIRNRELDLTKTSASLQIIDLTTVDTTQFSQTYLRTARYPIGGLSGYPMVIDYIDGDGLLDLAGSYRPDLPPELAECAIFELQPDSIFRRRMVYPDSVTQAIAITDVDEDGLLELNFRHRQLFDNYEQTDSNAYPDTFNFNHRMWQSGGRIDEETFMDFDNDNITDVLFRGDDTLVPFGDKVFIAEYRAAENRFETTLRFPPMPEWRVSNFSVGDFDQDGFKEFAVGSIGGDYYIVENTGDDAYEQIAQDTISISNAYLNAPTNDIDGNGKPEFFLGGSSFINGLPGSRVYWFEADGNNQFVKLRSFLLLGTDFLGTSRLYAYDVDADGQQELVFSFPFVIAILRWNRTSEQFDLIYYNYWEDLDQTIQSINIYDVFNSGRPDMFVNIVDLGSEPFIRTYLYRPNTLTGIDPEPAVSASYELQQNYPNPFNPQTQITFQLPKAAFVRLQIFDIRGQLIKTMASENRAAGSHALTWNGSADSGQQVGSGVYFYRLETKAYSQTKKMMLIR